MKRRTEDEVPEDTHVANARPTNAGDPQEDENTTGPGGNGEFIGGIQGQDEGYAGETGAERRAAAETRRRQLSPTAGAPRATGKKGKRLGGAPVGVAQSRG
jgi:hypothetical protein